VKQQTVAIIPARGGSRGIPRKNVIDVAGKPLIVWSIDAARAASAVDDVYVSTDDAEIAAVSRQCGAVVIERPAELAGDSSPSESALLHCLDRIEERGTAVSLVVFLQATSPVREGHDIDAAVELLRETGADSLFSCTKIEDYFMWEEAADGPRSVNYDFRSRKPRQDIAPRFLENGSIYVFTPGILREGHNRLGGKIAMYEMPFWKSWQIDDPDDIGLCEYYIRTRLLGEAAFR